MTPGDGKPTQGPGGQDGSMEDILASIRKILAEDSAQPMPPPPEPATPPGDEVLDLTEQMLAPDPSPAPKAEAPAMSAADIDALFEAPPQAAAAPMSAADIDALFDAPPPAAAAAPPAPAAPAAPPEQPSAPVMATAAPTPSPAAGEGLIGGSVAAAAAASFAALRAAARGPAEEARPAAADVLLGNGALTLEQMVREELRPLLKAWLDANLPPLVERLVKAELERVARG
jgi:cell pole-organizing protein PopZ